MEKTDLCSFTLGELETFFESRGEKSYRAGQVYQWIHQKLISDFSEMSNLPKTVRTWLADTCAISSVTGRPRTLHSKDTVKYLFELSDNTIIESVLMKYAYGNAVCVSSQVGCAMGCLFCASGVDGLERNLTAGEMCAQVYEMQKDASLVTQNPRCSAMQPGLVHSVVLMGSGEPLANLDNVLKFIHIINSPQGLAIGQRHITVSTCGLPDMILDLAEHRLQITLAVSLHAPNDRIRQQIMPVAGKYPIARVLDACAVYSRKTGRRITYEYALIDGLNDSRACATELGGLLRHTLSHVNLIPVNEVEGRSYRRSGKIDEFSAVLSGCGVKTTIRRELGSDINAACGQLRMHYNR